MNCPLSTNNNFCISLSAPDGLVSANISTEIPISDEIALTNQSPTGRIKFIKLHKSKGNKRNAKN